jgi:quercetin dioxygenase-like cupin family protein
MKSVIEAARASSLVVLAVAMLVPPALMAEAQHTGNVKITGKVSDKLIRRFDSSGLAGARSIEYRRLTMDPGARMDGLIVMDDHVEFCIVEKGRVTITSADGALRTYKAGDTFIKPKGLKQTVMAADPQDGYVELYWIIHLKGGH